MSKNIELKKVLKPRHITMLTLGSTIGSGIFKGSSSSISLAGPGVIFTYLLGGFILFIVMKSMAELAIHNPNASTLKDLLGSALGDFTGYFIGWMYWFNWVLVMAAEMTAAASFLQFWFAQTPLWLLAFCASIVMMLLNLFQANIYGETEYWLAGIKIFVLILFILFGFILLFTGFHHSVNIAQNVLGHGGILPHGMMGLTSAMLVVIFSFGGIEMIGMTLGETKNATQTIRKAVSGVILRVLLFYILPISIIISLVPWNVLSTSESPFVSVFSAIGIPYVGSIMNFVMLTAVLSAVNTGMYATSRMLYVQSLDGNAPKMFSVLSKGKVPIRALLLSSMFLYAGVMLAFFAKGHTFDYLMVFPGYAVLVIWGLLILAQIKRKPSWLSWIVFFSICTIFVGFLITTPIVGTVLTLSGFVLISISYFIGKQTKNRVRNSKSIAVK